MLCSVGYWLIELPKFRQCLCRSNINRQNDLCILAPSCNASQCSSLLIFIHSSHLLSLLLAPCLIPLPIITFFIPSHIIVMNFSQPVVIVKDKSIIYHHPMTIYMLMKYTSSKPCVSFLILNSYSFPYISLMRPIKTLLVIFFSPMTLCHHQHLAGFHFFTLVAW